MLFVLALLALFSLVTVTFVLVARQSKLSARAAASVERNNNPWQAQCESAALQALRGTNNQISVIGPHGLLEDVYGSDAVTGTIVNGFDDLPAANGTPLSSPGQPPAYPNIGGGVQAQVQKFLVRLDPGFNAPLYQYDGAYNGRVVTMLSGQAAGVSSRVLASTSTSITIPTDPAVSPAYGQTHVLDVVTFGADLAVGDRVLINGGAFNGTGFGYGFPLPLPTTQPILYLGSLDQDLPLNSTIPGLTFPYALLPNPVFFRPNTTDALLGTTATVAPWYVDPAGPGGADEAYDAVDYQNMLLALYVPGALTDGLGGTPVPLPSLHRPELIYYWAQKTGVLPPGTPMTGVTSAHLEAMETAAPGLLRRIMLRPWGGSANSDHPEFTGSNPFFNPCSLGSLNDIGRWDVDNDQDGVCDSVWVDLGSPVQTAADGRKYKPLYALLVVDEDSRLNANAHGSFAHFNGSALPIVPLNVRDATQGFRAGPYAGNWGGITPTGTGYPYLPMGQGYGPADVNLGFLFDPPASADNYAEMRDEYGRLLTGGATASGAIVEGRYGEASQLTVPAVPSPGYTAAPSATAGDWLDDYVRTGDMSYDYFNVQGLPSGVPPVFGSWGSPPDLNGNGALGLDLRGQPWYGDVYNRYGLTRHTGFGEWTADGNDKLNDPYELDLSWSGRQRNYLDAGGKLSTVDNPFSPGDLERLRRFNDVDASSLSSRLINLAPETFVNGINRNNPLDAAYRRNLITTESWDTPVASSVMMPDLMLLEMSATGTTPENIATSSFVGSVNSATQLSFVELVRRRLSQANSGAAYLTPTNQQTALPQLISWDLARGERLDLNRLLGNGIDGNANDAIDDPAEALSASGEALWGAGGATPLGTPLMDHNNDGVLGINAGSKVPSLADKNDGYARQLMARHLYVLAWSVIESQYYPAMGTARDGLRPLVAESLAPTVGTPASPTEQLEIRAAIARRLAQWAVNMVDFRDRDSIMTGFEYDVDPFVDDNNDGYPWDVDDDLTTDSAPGDVVSNPLKRSVVWGCERPELLITETLSVHDRRTQDTASEVDDIAGKANTNMAAMDPDVDFDQTKRPVGTLLFELYAPWNTTEGAAPELYNFDTDPLNAGVSIWQLDLARQSAAGNSPIWRVAVVEKSPALDKPPENKQYFPSDAEIPDIKRVVYFVNPGASPPTDCNKFYFRGAGGPLLLRPNTYAVVGPEDIGLPGRTVIKAASGGSDVTITYDPFQITVGAGALNPPYPTAGTEIKAPLGIMIDQPRRLSLSEPYPGENSKYDGWHAAMPADLDVAPTMINDIPWDHPTAPELNTEMPNPNKNGTTDGGPDTAIETNAYRTLVLQRLADPTRAWHAQTNPYLSVDRMPVDLTIYNSLEMAEDKAPVNAMAADYKFGSRQRGTIVTQSVAGTPLPAQVDIWGNRRVGRVAPLTGTPGTDIERTTLGYLNDVVEMHNLSGGPVVATPRPWRRLVQTVTDINYEVQAPATYGTEFIGDPEFPFPWLTWNNRPYAGKHELMLVPATSASELLSRHAVRVPLSTSADICNRSPFLLTGQDNATFNATDVFTGLQFGYVSPLLMSSWLDQSGEQFSLPNFHRILEFVTVPSRFAGTEMYLDPARFAATAGSASGHRFNPPFNRISAQREPGKVNINNVTDPKVWQAMMNHQPDGTPAGAGMPPSTVSWLKLLASRRGYGQVLPAGSPLVVDPAQPPTSVGGLPLPTFFANPFRSYAGLYLQPLPELQTANFVITPTVGTLAHPSGAGLWQNEIDATMLRVDQVTNGGNIPTALFASNPTLPTDTPPYADTLANPYFQYQMLQRLSNIATTRSNVYSMWITVGYFEVERAPADITRYPDGWRLKQEMGIDTGAVERHRSYFLIDRSLPVGFQRGEDHNVQQSILIKRMIE